MQVLLIDRARFPSDTISSHQVQVPGVARLNRWGLLGQLYPAGVGRLHGDRSPTITEVADRAGVSIATVSRVVSGRGRVREATRLRVEQAIAATGWAVDPAARQLAGGTGDEVVLAVAVADRREFASDPYYARVIAGAHEETARHGLSLSVHVASLRSLAGLAPFGGTQRHMGAILVNASAEEAASIGGLSRPVVSMGAVAPAVPSVDPENEAGVSAAVGHLLAQGRRRIAMISGPGPEPVFPRAAGRLTGRSAP